MTLELLERQRKVLERLNMLPRKILSFHDHQHLADFILHELCDEHCFNIDRAAYFIDNPDFDCLRGVSGYCRTERYADNSDIWVDPLTFSKKSQGSSFNEKVRSVLKESSKKHGKNDQETSESLANLLNLSRHGFYSWPMKYDNSGIFIYERLIDADSEAEDKFLPDGVALLGFCPL